MEPVREFLQRFRHSSKTNSNKSRDKTSKTRPRDKPPDPQLEQVYDDTPVNIPEYEQNRYQNKIDYQQEHYGSFENGQNHQDQPYQSSTGTSAQAVPRRAYINLEDVRKSVLPLQRQETETSPPLRESHINPYPIFYRSPEYSPSNVDQRSENSPAMSNSPELPTFTQGHRNSPIHSYHNQIITSPTFTPPKNRVSATRNRYSPLDDFYSSSPPATPQISSLSSDGHREAYTPINIYKRVSTLIPPSPGLIKATPADYHPSDDPILKDQFLHERIEKYRKAFEDGKVHGWRGNEFAPEIVSRTHPKGGRRVGSWIDGRVVAIRDEIVGGVGEVLASDQYYDDWEVERKHSIIISPRGREGYEEDQRARENRRDNDGDYDDELCCGTVNKQQITPDGSEYGDSRCTSIAPMSPTLFLEEFERPRARRQIEVRPERPSHIEHLQTSLPSNRNPARNPDDDWDVRRREQPLPEELVRDCGQKSVQPSVSVSDIVPEWDIAPDSSGRPWPRGIYGLPEYTENSITKYGDSYSQSTQLETLQQNVVRSQRPRPEGIYGGPGCKEPTRKPKPEQQKNVRNKDDDRSVQNISQMQTITQPLNSQSVRLQEYSIHYDTRRARYHEDEQPINPPQDTVPRKRPEGVYGGLPESSAGSEHKHKQQHGQNFTLPQTVNPSVPLQPAGIYESFQLTKPRSNAIIPVVYNRDARVPLEGPPAPPTFAGTPNPHYAKTKYSNAPIPLPSIPSDRVSKIAKAPEVASPISTRNRLSFQPQDPSTILFDDEAKAIHASIRTSFHLDAISAAFDRSPSPPPVPIPDPRTWTAAQDDTALNLVLRLSERQACLERLYTDDEKIYSIIKFLRDEFAPPTTAPDRKSAGSTYQDTIITTADWARNRSIPSEKSLEEKKMEKQSMQETVDEVGQRHDRLMGRMQELEHIGRWLDLREVTFEALEIETEEMQEGAQKWFGRNYGDETAGENGVGEGKRWKGKNSVENEGDGAEMEEIDKRFFEKVQTMEKGKRDRKKKMRTRAKIVKDMYEDFQQGSKFSDNF